MESLSPVQPPLLQAYSFMLTDGERWDVAKVVFIAGWLMSKQGSGGPKCLSSHAHSPTGEGTPVAHGYPGSCSVSALLGPGT